MKIRLISFSKASRKNTNLSLTKQKVVMFPPSLSELHQKLINHEAKLLSYGSASTYPISANYANNRHLSNQQNNNQCSNQPWHNSQSSNQSRTPRPYLGRCQICGVQGHSAKRCSQFNTAPQSAQKPLLPTPPYPPSPWLPRANLATANSSQPWVLDTGATHYITSDLTNLSLHQPYNGGQEVIVGNGNGLPITHTGFASLPSNNKPLSLTNVLYVPDIKKNLISVYRLCNANKVFVEFFPAHFQVKDLTSGAPLLQGRTNEELYEWPITQSAAAFYATPTVKASFSDWHSRLGHPALPILKFILLKYSLPFICFFTLF
uniref:Retrovirus-related Pol polyprotein from transposon TNT 1-94-like beta-barrel domain-containing protein n=1 Tax=Noccaea caerulescens TaxID=107243 RepID=A0A1J3ILL6_NOCCA